jgi:hypothetical protein
LYHDSDEEDKIPRLSQSSDHSLEMKITKVQPGRKLNHITQSPTFDSDIQAKHCQNVTNSKELNRKKRQISKSLKMSDMRPQSALQKDESSSSSTTKKLTKPSIPSVFAGLKKTVQTGSSAKLTAKIISNPFKDGQRPLIISGPAAQRAWGEGQTWVLL